MTKSAQSWIDGAEDALEMAENSLGSGKLLWAIFFCHLAVEKMLKGVVHHVTGELPPKTHSLPRLIALSGLSPSRDVLDFLAVVNELSVPTRYPENQLTIRKRFDKAATVDFLKRTTDVVKWIRQSLKS